MEWLDEKTQCGESCRATMEQAANHSMQRSMVRHDVIGLPGRMVASDAWPTLASPTFAPIGARCPHGTQFWAYPDANRIEALTQLNEGRYPPEVTS